ncbi:CHAT domain-containing protein [Agrobacterium tumefaciens]|uniref:CHAT domain-containing protein n=1 Tax=Agrobacterium tumefaciens complex TaxID=1183400 RepID=UPI0009BB1E4C|nr:MULTISPECIES: CHAT domain-containing protein [Agrobacterium tumefaciens complex]NSY95813.1 CHAT domain-containing protein [Agrobacterium tumefaciens]NTE91935.1 CHAT domain-containing protein [Agrobacterium tumefaciens]
MRSKPIDDVYAQFLKMELESGEAHQTKSTLQEICRLHRQGFQFREPIRSTIETLVSGLLIRLSQDRKVVRWCLNAIAQFGRKDFSLAAVQRSIEVYGNDPEIAGAAVAAMFKIDARTLEHANAIELQREIVVLGAMQNTDPGKLDLRDISIDVDSAHPNILKLALITVGIGRAVKNLFHPRYENSEIVRVLGKHDDDIVRQYSVWAIIEHTDLGPEHLGIDLKELEKEPANVRAKVYGLLATHRSKDFQQQEYLIRGADDDHPEARMGLATMLASTYYDGMETATVNWLENEPNEKVREVLLGHFARCGSKCPAYQEFVIDHFDKHPSSQERLMGMAAGTKFYGILERRRQQGQNLDLFPMGDDARYEKVMPMKILMLSATPEDEERLRVDEENREIKRHIRENGGKLDIGSEFAVKVSDLQGHLLREKPDVLHFSGHGSSASSIVLEDAQGQAFDVDPQALADLMKMFKSHLKCVILNCCYSDAQAAAISQHIPFVIGCDDSVGDTAALTFAYAFYRALSHDRGFEDAFEFGVNEINLTSDRAESKMYKIHKA